MGCISRWLLTIASILALGACATTTPAPQAQLPAVWPDAAFDYQPTRVTVDATELLRLDASLIAQLQSPMVQKLSLDNRAQYLLTQLLGHHPTPFRYRTGQSTTAHQTWADRRGDCLSLTVLALAMAQHLRLNAVVQEVSVPPNFDRRGGLDFRNGHVNLYIDSGPAMDSSTFQGFKSGWVVDFEPSEGVPQRGRTLSMDALLARYYNNRGAQALAEGDHHQAYAFFKHAVLRDPAFGPALTNLAWVYRHHGDPAAAEAALHLAMQREEGRETAVYALHQLLVAQGRDSEAQTLRAALEADRKNDPYYWINLGHQHLQEGNTYRAVSALERAQDLTTGFAEVHRYLAQAYLLQGKTTKAQEQLDTLARINQQDTSLSALQSKLSKKLRN